MKRGKGKEKLFFHEFTCVMKMHGDIGENLSRCFQFIKKVVFCFGLIWGGSHKVVGGGGGMCFSPSLDPKLPSPLTPIKKSCHCRPRSWEGLPHHKAVGSGGGLEGKRLDNSAFPKDATFQKLHTVLQHLVEENLFQFPSSYSFGESPSPPLPDWQKKMANLVFLFSDDVVRRDRAPACEVREKDGKFWSLFLAEEKLPHLTGYKAGAVLRG